MLLSLGARIIADPMETGYTYSEPKPSLFKYVSPASIPGTIY